MFKNLAISLVAISFFAISTNTYAMYKADHGKCHGADELSGGW